MTETEEVVRTCGDPKCTDVDHLAIRTVVTMTYHERLANQLTLLRGEVSS